MRVLITGAGMVGCHAAAELLAQGDRVTFFDLSPQEAYVREVAGVEAAVLRGDVRELPALIGALRDVRPDVVVHTAALIGGAAQRSPYGGFQVNIGGALNVAEAVRLMGVRRLVHASTLGVHDLAQPQSGPITESFPVGGADAVYGASKVACEQIMRTYARTYGFELAMLRFGSVYGYGHYAGGSGIGIAMSELLRAALAGRPAPIGARLAAPEDLVYAADVGRGVALAVRADRLPHEVYNVSGGRICSPEEVVEALRRVVPGATIGERAAARPGEHRRQRPMDLARAGADLGYEPRFDLEAGLRDFARRLRG